MLTFKQKIQYLLDSVIRHNEPIICPYCSNTQTTEIDRKYFVTRLLACNECKLYFRHPLESIESNKAFYQDDYVEADGITTDMPNQEELQELKNTAFSKYPERNATKNLSIFKSLFDNLSDKKIVDYGASWGYFSYQFKEKGMNVRSYEISQPRANFGNKNLSLNIKTQVTDLDANNDIFFSSHVIEHLPSIKDMLTLAKSLLTKDGYFIALCPNGSKDYAKIQPDNFHKVWGKVHPNLLNVDFYKYIFSNNPYFIGSNPYDFQAMKLWNKNNQIITNTQGEELLIIVKLNQNIK